VLDDDVRCSCFHAFEVLSAKHGIEVPYIGGLDQGFTFRGRRVPFLNQEGSIGPRRSAVRSAQCQHLLQVPYDDEERPDGFVYAYRAGAIDEPETSSCAVSNATVGRTQG
jgi:hypothetical protein